MKTAIYVKEGVTQVVLTPENKWEQRIVELICNSPSHLKVLRGSFYETQGGWYRESADDLSLILVVSAPNVDISSINQ